MCDGAQPRRAPLAANHWRSGNLGRRTLYCLLGAAAQSDAALRDGIRWFAGAYRVGLARAARRGEIQHKNLWIVDLETGAMQQLTHMPAEFDVRDFDLSADGAEAILERAGTLRRRCD
jgi:hypothetical protein